MLVLCITVFLVITGLIIKRSNLLGYITLIWMWILFGWSYGNADFLNYEYKFNNIDKLSKSFELLFSTIISIFKNAGMSYQQFLIICSLIFIICIWQFAKRNTNNWYFVISLYIIYPFMMDVVQVRNSMALMFVWIGFDALMNYNGKKELCRYLLCIGVATLIHSATLIFIILLIPLFLNRKKIISITGVLSIGGFVAINFLDMFLLKIATTLQMGDRFYQASKSSFNIDLRKSIIIIMLFVSYQVGILIIKSSDELLSRIDKKVIDLMEKINIVMLITLPMSMILPDIYRMMGALALPNFILWGKTMKIKGSKYILSKDEALLRLWGGVSAVVNIYILVLSSVNINTVFYPLIYDNRLLN